MDAFDTHYQKYHKFQKQRDQVLLHERCGTDNKWYKVNDAASKQKSASFSGSGSNNGGQRTPSTSSMQGLRSSGADELFTEPSGFTPRKDHDKSVNNGSNALDGNSSFEPVNGSAGDNGNGDLNGTNPDDGHAVHESVNDSGGNNFMQEQVDHIQAMEKAHVTFRILSGVDLIFDVCQVDDHPAGSLFQLFFQYFHELPWSCTNYYDYVNTALSSTTPFVSLKAIAREKLGSDASLLINLASKVCKIVKKYQKADAAVTKTVNWTDHGINAIDKAVTQLRNAVQKILRDNCSLIDQIDQLKEEIGQQVVANKKEQLSKDAALSNIKSEIMTKITALTSSKSNIDFGERSIHFISLFDAWMYMCYKHPEQSVNSDLDASNEMKGNNNDGNNALNIVTEEADDSCPPSVLKVMQDLQKQVASLTAEKEAEKKKQMNADKRQRQDAMHGNNNNGGRGRGNGRGRGRGRGNYRRQPYNRDNGMYIMHDSPSFNEQCSLLIREKEQLLQLLNKKERYILNYGSRNAVQQVFGNLNQDVIDFMRISNKYIVDFMHEKSNYLCLQVKDGQKSVHNLTAVTLSNIHLELISFGSSFICTPRNVSKDELCIVFEELQTRVLKKFLYEGKVVLRPLKEKRNAVLRLQKPHQKNSFTVQIEQIVDPKRMTNIALHGIKQVDPNLSSFEKKEMIKLQKLVSMHRLKLIEADKGMGICIIDTDEYNKRVMNELKKLDTSFVVKSMQANEDAALIEESIKWRNKINTLIRDSYNQSRDMKTYVTKYLNSYAEVELPTIKGLPKLHKEGERMRIILPFDRNIFCRIHCFIACILTPLAQRIETALFSSLELINELEPMSMHGNDILVTADLDSMYNRINIKVAAELTLEFMQEYGDEFQIFGKKGDLTNKSVWFHLIVNAFNKCYFRFNDKLIHQKYRVVMGSPAGPLLATIYINRIIKKNISRFPMISMHRMYIDDGFLRFDAATKEEEIPSLLDKLIEYPGSTLAWDRKSIHIRRVNALKEDPLVFLDTLIKCEKINEMHFKLNFAVYCKPMGTYPYVHRRSCHPEACMKSIAYAEATRRLRLSTKQVDYEESLNDLRVKLMKRGHRLHIINEQLNRVPFSCRKQVMEGPLLKFAAKRDPKLNFNPLMQEKKETISGMIPLIVRYDPRIISCMKAIKNMLQNELNTKIFSDSKVKSIRIILAWKNNQTLINQIMKNKFFQTEDERNKIDAAKED